MTHGEERHATEYDAKEFKYDGRDYTFWYDSGMVHKKGGKTVYFGYFRDEAPAQLQVDIWYCLKEITASDPKKEACAASRECYDLLDYSGAHLREIYLRNDKAEAVAEELRKTNTLQNTISGCIIIEPCYKSTRKFFTDCGKYSVAFRLDLVRQYALGSKELSSRSNMIQNRSIMAVRDLKAENGVYEELQNGDVRVRLVDFASIWMDTLKTTGTRVASNGTMQLALSPENTCPENVIKEFKVSEKTDVYALGMLMGSLFLRHQGAYVNPNERWLVAGNLWNEYDMAGISNQMKRCSEAYDQEENPASSWIERDLKEKYGMELAWETMENQEAAYRIRKLFCKATRIDPDKRINRNGFIAELEKICKLVESWVEQRQPVNIYLFNNAQADQYAVGYQLAAAKAFMTDREEAIREGNQIPQALCVSYGAPQNGMIQNQQKQLGSNPCINKEELSHSISLLQQCDSADQDYLLYGILHAYRILNTNERAYFAGKVYLFTPQIPTQEQMAPMYQNGRQYDLFALCGETLGVSYNKETEFTAFTAQPPKEALDWCTWESVRKQSTDLSAEKEPRQEKSNMSEYAGLQFDVGDTAPYIKLPDGKRAYIRIKK